MDSRLILDKNTPEYVSINEPFNTGRSASRLFFDFGIMLSCFEQNAIGNNKVLDFAAGTCWISEWLNRMGFDVTAFDINSDSEKLCSIRTQCDLRTNSELMHFQLGDGHIMPFADSSFSHICCFDSLHHMHDYQKVFSEFHRILTAGGRAIFVEPGAKHSTSKETIEFIEKYKKNDPSWIERDVILEEIYQISKNYGFKSMHIRPVLWPELREYDIQSWLKFREGNRALETDYLSWLKDFNYSSRICFYLKK
ncbi:MAG: class I SAM-dependent methyltransferase [Sulfuricaulis sp.]